VLLIPVEGGMKYFQRSLQNLIFPSGFEISSHPGLSVKIPARPTHSNVDHPGK
jgi:hypothetical protein